MYTSIAAQGLHNFLKVTGGYVAVTRNRPAGQTKPEATGTARTHMSS